MTVNAIAPGSIDTPLTRDHYDDMDDPVAHSKLPLRRFGRPDDVAGDASSSSARRCRTT